MTRSRDVADTQDNIGGAVAPFVAGKNKIINGDFGIWQRGTSFSSDGYTSDRWRFSKNAGTTASISRQSFTLGTAPVAGYEGTFFARYQRTAGAFDDYFLQRVENARTFANTITKLSFWAKASSNTTISQVYAAQVTNGTGGSGSGNFSGLAITTSWQRYTVDITLPSLSGATIGSNDFVEVVFKFGSEMGNITVDIWGVQWEAGSVATPFQTSTGTLEGELTSCQRYYWRQTAGSSYTTHGVGYAYTTDAAVFYVKFPTRMRIPPTSVEYSNLAVDQYGVTNFTFTTMIIQVSTTGIDAASVQTSGSSGLTVYRPYGLLGNNSTSNYLGFSAEL